MLFAQNAANVHIKITSACYPHDMCMSIATVNKQGKTYYMMNVKVLKVSLVSMDHSASLMAITSRVEDATCPVS